MLIGRIGIGPKIRVGKEEFYLINHWGYIHPYPEEGLPNPQNCFYDMGLYLPFQAIGRDPPTIFTTYTVINIIARIKNVRRAGFKCVVRCM